MREVFDAYYLVTLDGLDSIHLSPESLEDRIKELIEKGDIPPYGYAMHESINDNGEVRPVEEWDEEFELIKDKNPMCEYTFDEACP